ncbi:hypothetical protein FAM15192_001617 [Propionibacterium freudenreichii]|uniref:hypothetical protein n=1 Tax=Propionibacterium freudenreichii TaxID=1744 RepID=UPI00254A276F|nr:hypothetical protein [Propionibacterium freudenreichii]MDK9640012.1 hypothetical protein [Propionibacterium freudenreichii]
MRSLWKHPAALPKDERSRVDAILAANALVLAAKEAGFRIEGHVQPRKRSHTYGVYTGEPFVTLDAGDCPVLVRVGELVKRVPHVLTDEEKLRKKLNQYAYAPAYDYEPSGFACFRVYPEQSYRGGTRYLETKTKKLESVVPRIIAEVEGASEVARARAERQREWAEERRREEIARRELAEKRNHYEKWESALEQQASAWARAQQLRAFLDEAATKDLGDGAEEFLAWARAHVEELDPLNSPTWPSGEVPVLDHSDRRKMGRPPEQPWMRW